MKLTHEQLVEMARSVVQAAESANDTGSVITYSQVAAGAALFAKEFLAVYGQRSRLDDNSFMSNLTPASNDVTLTVGTHYSFTHVYGVVVKGTLVEDTTTEWLIRDKAGMLEYLKKSNFVAKVQ